MAHKTIKSLDQIKSIESRVFVRWSKSIAKDTKRGYSLAYGTSAEAGLSCVELDKKGDDYKIIRQLTEYKYICSGTCWIITGEVVETGEDNEPLLANVEVIGKASSALTSLEWRQIELDQDIAMLEHKLATTENTDEIGLRISRNWLADMKKERLQKYGY